MVIKLRWLILLAKQKAVKANSQVFNEMQMPYSAM
jgi:hypothetical protein